MDNHNGKYSGKALFITFLGGAVAGAIAGILLTDRSGQETRWELRAALDDVIERGKTFITEKRSDIGAA